MANNNPPRNARTAAPRSGSRTPFYAVLIALVVIGAGVLLWIARSPAPASGGNDAAYQALAQNYQSAGPPQPYTLGDSTAPVTIEEFADFECPSCGRYATVTEPDVRARLVQTGKVYYKYYDFPLPMHKNTQAASNAAACADEQGKFWPMHDQIFNGQGEWGLGPGEGELTDNPGPIFRRYAQAIGLNVDQWQRCFDARKYQARINANTAEAFRRHVEQTPTFFINGKMVAGAIPFDEIQSMVNDAAAHPKPVAGAAPGTTSVPPRPGPAALAPADTASGTARGTAPVLRGH